MMGWAGQWDFYRSCCLALFFCADRNRSKLGKDLVQKKRVCYGMRRHTICFCAAISFQLAFLIVTGSSAGFPKKNNRRETFKLTFSSIYNTIRTENEHKFAWRR